MLIRGLHKRASSAQIQSSDSLEGERHREPHTPADCVQERVGGRVQAVQVILLRDGLERHERRRNIQLELEDRQDLVEHIVDLLGVVATAEEVEQLVLGESDRREEQIQM